MVFFTTLRIIDRKTDILFSANYFFLFGHLFFYLLKKSAKLRCGSHLDMDDEYLVMECILRGKENLYPQLLNDIINDMIKSLPAGKREYWQRLKEDKNKKETLGNMMKSFIARNYPCLLYTSPSPRDLSTSRMPSSA